MYGTVFFDGQFSCFLSLYFINITFQRKTDMNICKNIGNLFTTFTFNINMYIFDFLTLFIQNAHQIKYTAGP